MQSSASSTTTTTEILVQSKRLRADLQFYRTLESCNGGASQFTKFTKLCYEVCTELAREVKARFGGSGKAEGGSRAKVDFLAIEWIEERSDSDGDPSQPPVILAPFCLLSASHETVQKIWEQRDMLPGWVIKARAIKGEFS